MKTRIRRCVGNRRDHELMRTYEAVLTDLALASAQCDIGENLEKDIVSVPHARAPPLGSKRGRGAVTPRPPNPQSLP